LIALVLLPESDLLGGLAALGCERQLHALPLAATLMQVLLRLRLHGAHEAFLLTAARTDWEARCALELWHVVLTQHNARVVIFVVLVNGMQVVSL